MYYLYAHLSVGSWGVVDEGVLEERPEHEEDAHSRPHVDSLRVGHRRQRVVDRGLQEGEL